MKILHVIAGMRKAAGTSVFAGEVANELASQGHDVAIAVADPKCEDCYKLDLRVKLIGFDDLIHSSFSTSNSYLHLSYYDIVHIHALWDLRLNKIAKAIHCPTRSSHSPKLVWSPHGMLTPWALRNKWWKKLLGLALYQYWSLRKADLIHVTAQSEVEDVRRLGLKNEVVVAPLGVRVNEVGDMSGSGTKEGKTLLFVSRVQRKKGLPNLLDAWARLPKDLTKDWTIRIVGPDQDGHTAELIGQCQSLGLSWAKRRYAVDSQSEAGVGIQVSLNSACPEGTCVPEVQFIGPKYDDELDREYRNADLFVLPTHSENFGSVVVEALARGVPVICTKEAPWEELETYKCGWWIDDNVDALETALRDGLSRVERGEHVEMGANGLKLVQSKYDWKVIGKTISDAYWSISHGCEKGRCVDCAELYDTCSP